MTPEEIGKWSFIAGVVIAILAGLGGAAVAAYASSIAMVLIVLGILVGFLNITQKETHGFLVAAIALLLTGAAGLEKLPIVGAYVEPILINIATFVAPAAVIVALKAIYDIGKK